MFDMSRIEDARAEGLDRYLDSLRGFSPDSRLVVPGSVVVRQMFRSYHELKVRPGTYRVEFDRAPTDKFHDTTGLYLLFRIRDYSGNPTQIGSSLGIVPRDRMINLNSPEGTAIDNFLVDLARNYAGQMAGSSNFEDKVSNMKPSLRRRVWKSELDEYVVV